MPVVEGKSNHKRKLTYNDGSNKRVKTIASKGACWFCNKPGHFKNNYMLFLMKNNKAQVKAKEEGSMVEMFQGMDLTIEVDYLPNEFHEFCDIHGIGH